jgi:heme/copper-type cytochrome/quinol oxidase subunit 3
MGWCHQVIKEKPIAHDLSQQQKDLFFFTKLFLVSEFAAFAAVFAYFYARAHIDEAFVPPPGLHLGNPLVGFATILLLSSSVTCEIAHHALLAAHKAKTRWMLLSTIILGVIFLGFQGFEYGEFIAAGYGFASMPDESYNSFMSLFFISTGFHGFHVLTGLVMLTLVYVRLELGHFNPKRHFSMMAASLYWHFVDVIWIFLFLTVYVLSPVAH